jgi:thiosulfate dehydrogenase [quinone] large subunit
MTDATSPALWTRASWRERPARMSGITLLIVLRFFFALFFTGATANKLIRGWLWSDSLKQIFTARIAELDPGSFGYAFLEKFGIPWSYPVGVVVTFTEAAVMISMWLGFATRAGGLLAIWLMVMFAIGGYYDASLIGLWAWAALFVVFPTGHWLGMDRRLHERHPDSIWFR